MFFGRFAMMIPPLALAGVLAGKKSVATTAGTFTTTSPIFVLLLIGVIVIVGALTFFPADALDRSSNTSNSFKGRHSK